jgi:type IV secretory pathway VirB2 component (pilin)
VSSLLAGLENDGSKLEAVYNQVLSAVGGNAAQAIAIIWDYIDDIYGAVGPNKIEVNEAFTRLGVVYADYLKHGGMALTQVVAKYTPDDGDANTTPERLQSLHDNLLGNINNYALTQRYVNENNVPTLYISLKELIERSIQTCSTVRLIAVTRATRMPPREPGIRTWIRRPIEHKRPAGCN